jgi:hypothetical protein
MNFKEQIEQKYKYDKGFFIYRNGSREGEPAGWRDKDGYIYLYFDGKNYPLHHLVFMYFNNKKPDFDIDHIDGDKINNKINNLREATKKENNQNRCTHSDNKTGFKGVVQYGEKYRAYIKHDGVTINLGSFDTPEEASAVYKKESKKLFGEFYNER